MLGSNETIDQSAMTNKVCWYGHMLKREVDHVTRRAIWFDVKGESKKGRPKRTCKKQVGEKA